MRAIGAILLAVFLTALFNLPALANRRVALVMGNSAYQNVGRLTNPTSDSEAVSNVFKEAGFDVVELKQDLNVNGMRRALRDFSDRARDADIAVFYYAGHGVEINGNNYLIPTDAVLERDIDAFDEAIPLDRVLTVIEPAKQLRLIILDACRDNPFSKTMKRTIGSRAVGRGLAKVEPENPNTLIAFAAKAGSVALDGEGKNSPFTTALVKYLPKPGLDLRKAFGFARDEVLKVTNNRQEPFIYGSLGGDDVALVPQIAKAAANSDAEARIDYELAAQIGTKDAWDAFLTSHPDGLYASLARAQNNKLVAAQQSRAKADDARREAEEQAAEKAAELHKQLEEQNKRQSAEAKQLSDQAKKDLEEAKKQVELAQKQAESARLEVDKAKREAIADAQVQVEQANRAAREDAEKIASLMPNQTPPDVPSVTSKIDQTDINRLLQAHLKRVGCNFGNVEGNWDESSRRALELFNQNAQTKFDMKVASLDALDAVRNRPDRVCPLVCAKSQRADGDRCVQIGCRSGYFINSSGACEKRPESAPKARTATRESASPARAMAPSSSGKTCGFDASGHRVPGCLNPATW